MEISRYLQKLSLKTVIVAKYEIMPYPHLGDLARREGARGGLELVKMATEKTRTAEISEIKNKIKRNALYKKEKIRKAKEKRQRKLKRKREETQDQEEVSDIELPYSTS